MTDLAIPISIKTPTNRSSEYLTSRETHSDIIVHVVDLLRNLPTMKMEKRVERAIFIEEALKGWKSTLSTEMHFESSTKNISSSKPSAFRHAAQALSMYSASEFLLCLITRPFLMNDAAPAHLQFAALNHARKIIEAMPVLVTLANSPWVSSSTFNWSSGHLFTAATIFATVFLSDHGDAEKLWPAEDLDWFSTVMFDIVDSFHLVFQGSRSYTAKVCKDLLLALCNSREALKERFQSRGMRMMTRATTPPQQLALATSGASSHAPQSQVHQLIHPLPSFEMDIEAAQAFLDENSTSTPNNLVFDEFNFSPSEWALLTSDLELSTGM